MSQSPDTPLEPLTTSTSATDSTFSETEGTATSFVMQDMDMQDVPCTR